MTVSDLPAINACFNTLSTLFLTLGFVFIRKGRKAAALTEEVRPWEAAR